MKVNPPTSVSQLNNPEAKQCIADALVRAVCGADDFHSALEALLKEVCRFTGWPFGQVWYLPAGSRHLECAPVYRATCKELATYHDQCRNQRFRRGEALPGTAWETAKPVQVSVYVNNQHNAGGLPAGKLGVQSAIAIPLNLSGELVGVLDFQIREPQETDEKFMHLIFNAQITLASCLLRKHSESALRDVEMRYDILTETTNDIIFRLTTDCCFISLNRAFEIITGWSRSEWLNKPLNTILHPDDKPAVLERLQAILKGYYHHTGQYRMRKANGGFTIFEVCFSPESNDGTITGLIGVARDITEHKRTVEAIHQSEEHYRELFHEAYKMQEKLRHLSNRVLQVQEQEMARISRDLHDEVGQSLTAINVNLTIIEGELQTQSPEIPHRISNTQKILEQTMERVHNFSRDLRPAMLDDLGLIPSLRSFGKKFTGNTSLPVRLEIKNDAEIEELDSERKTVIYRIVQEGLNNILKHAKANQVILKITGNPYHVNVSLEDDGRGFDMENCEAGEESGENLGLLGIGERLRLVNGKFTMESKPGRGTKLHATIPYRSV